MANLVFEILTEDIPANLQIKAEQDLKNLFILALSNYKVNYESLTSYSTPRRIAIVVNDIAERIADIIVEKKGPAVNANEAAINGFLATNNLTINDCITKQTEKGEFYFANLITKGGDLKAKLPKIIVEDVLLKMTFKKSMFWNETKIKWMRPIRGLLLMLNSELVKFEFAGVTVSNKLYGHRFLSETTVELKHANNYVDSMAELKVILAAKANINSVDGHEVTTTAHIKAPINNRESIIVSAVNDFAKKHEINPNMPKELVDEIVYLVEYPVVLFAEIPAEYLKLPKELLVNIMVKNQRYINFFNKDGSINKFFAIVANITAADNGTQIIKGNQKVLNARLEDGLFFYNLDIKTSLSSKIENLKKLNFFEGIGSIFDKKERIKELAEQLFKADNLNNLIDLYKADLTSEVVKEMPELQGIIGGYYAALEGLSSPEVLAIQEQYKPNGQTDTLPSNLLGAKLALLDKLDNLISFNKIGKMPTGSGDQFGLRRSALGIIRIIIDYQLNLNLAGVINQQLQHFLLERLEIYLKTAAINSTIIKAIVAINNSNQEAAFNLNEIYQKAVILNHFLSENGDLLALYKRVFNILAVNGNLMVNNNVKQELLENKEEQDLFNIYKQVEASISKHLLEYNYKAAIEQLVILKPYLDKFLDNTLIVNKANLEITQNRLGLLNLILILLQQIAHFELIN